jgi:hypothetical protein
VGTGLRGPYSIVKRPRSSKRSLEFGAEARLNILCESRGSTQRNLECNSSCGGGNLYCHPHTLLSSTTFGPIVTKIREPAIRPGGVSTYKLISSFTVRAAKAQVQPRHPVPQISKANSETELPAAFGATIFLHAAYPLAKANRP